MILLIVAVSLKQVVNFRFLDEENPNKLKKMLLQNVTLIVLVFVIRFLVVYNGTENL